MMQHQSYLLFQSGGGQGALLPLLQLRKVAFDLPLTPVYGAPEAVAGIVNWQGRVITAICMARLLAEGRHDECLPDLSAPARGTANMLPRSGANMPPRGEANMIVGDEGRLYSLIVHSCGDILSFSPDTVEPLPMAHGIWRDVASGIYRHNGSALPVLDAPRLVKHVETLCAGWKKTP